MSLLTLFILLTIYYKLKKGGLKYAKTKVSQFWGK